MALQEAALDDRQTGRELLTLQGRLYGLSAAQIRTRLGEVLDLVDIGAAIDRRIGTYSGGMKRRLDLAAALIHNPEVLFLDEPTTGLDPLSRASVWAEVRRLNAELGMTIFLTTQYLDEADALADRVGIIARAAWWPRVTRRPEAFGRPGPDRGRGRGGRPRTLATLCAPQGHRRRPWRRRQDHRQHPDGPAALSPVAIALGRDGPRGQEPHLADADPGRRLHGADRSHIEQEDVDA